MRKTREKRLPIEKKRECVVKSRRGKNALRAFNKLTFYKYDVKVAYIFESVLLNVVLALCKYYIIPMLVLR